MFIKKEDNLVIHNDKDVLVVNGECPSCKSGRHSLILIDFVPKEKSGEGLLYIQCMACSSIFQTKVKNVSE